MLLYVVTNNYVSLMVLFLGYFQSTERVDGTKHVGFLLKTQTGLS